MSLYPNKTFFYASHPDRGVVDVMREKEASGDPDMIDFKYFLMNEVLTGL